ncbi:unnamed protein product [Phytomonas sp. EM1]|nr:unnamed protein product [Phytomonas sp. EM1]|eukprot:CCW64346.1 unnamed protein product [Phytomonas sp. isolate EM1]
MDTTPPGLRPHCSTVASSMNFDGSSTSLCRDIVDNLNAALTALKADFQQLANIHRVEALDSPNAHRKGDNGDIPVESKGEIKEKEPQSTSTSSASISIFPSPSLQQFLSTLQQERLFKTIQAKKLAEEHPLRWEKVQSVKALLDELRNRTGLDLLSDELDRITPNGELESDGDPEAPLLDLGDDNASVKTATSREWNKEGECESGDHRLKKIQQLASAFRFQVQHAGTLEQETRKLEALIRKLRNFFNDDDDVLAASSHEKANLVRLLEAWPTHSVSCAAEEEAWRRWAVDAPGDTQTKHENADKGVKNLRDALRFAHSNRSRFEGLMRRWRGIRSRYEATVQHANRSICYITLRLDEIEEKLEKEKNW